MGDIKREIGRSLDEMERLVQGTEASQLTDPTPCAKWTVKDLLNHFVGGGYAFGAAFAGSPPDYTQDPGDLVGDDPVGAFAEARKAFETGLGSPGALEREVTLPIGTLPGQLAAQIAFADITVHCWDLATATGQTFDPPADLIDQADAILRQVIAPELRDGDVFAAEVQPPADATPAQRMAAFAGRAV